MEALDQTQSSNMLTAHPTGTGKSLPMLLLGLFLPAQTTTTAHEGANPYSA